MKLVAYDTREAWLGARRACVTSSDIPVLLGLLADVSPWTLWLEKINRAPEREATYWMRRGHSMEPFTCSEFVAATGRRVEDPGDFTLAYHPEIPWAAATVDRLSAGPQIGDEPEEIDAVLELKAAVAYGMSKWGEAPDAYAVAQVQWQLMVTGLQLAHIAVDMQTRLQVYAVGANPKLQAALLAKAREFWRYVETQTQPPEDGHPATGRTLAEYFDEPCDEVKQLPPEATERYSLMREAETVAKAATAEADTEKNYFRLQLGNAVIGAFPDGSAEVTWKADRNGRRNLRFREMV